MNGIKEFKKKASHSIKLACPSATAGEDTMFFPYGRCSLHQMNLISTLKASRIETYISFLYKLPRSRYLLQQHKTD